ncbi:MAG: class I tRNA ligase family protein, partial [Bacteroidales bacterium]|nr:class I tRNA ligase family protein [Bacteroidales bacterium]
DDGTLSEAAGMFVGVDRFKARDLSAELMSKTGDLLKVENYTNKIGRSERTNSVIEPKLSIQWFLKMEEISKPALKAVVDDDLRLHPSKFKNLYRHWMENVHDWCISRQLWWGHRIPAYYFGKNEYVVAETAEDALRLAIEKSGNKSLTLSDLKQDEDVLDTWFSSWLWPITCFDGINNPDNEDIKYYYPTNDLVTAPEILFFWVARMIIAGYEYKGDMPFKNVYLTGIVRDQLRRKMSKSLGNSPDPIDLINKYGADGVRVGMLLCSPAGNDLLYDDSLPEQGRNFANKIWNAFRLVMNWKVDDSIPQPEHCVMATKWMGEVIAKGVSEVNDDFEKFKISEALMKIYKLFWDEFSGWYLEIIKPAYEKPIDATTYKATIGFFNDLLKIIHPFMPFITEEIWHLIEERKEGESIMVCSMPGVREYDASLVNDFETAKEVITSIRNIRTEKNIPNKESVSLFVKADKSLYDGKMLPIISKLCNLDNISFVTEKADGTASFLVGTVEYYVPLGDKLNIDEEMKKAQEDLAYYEGF